MFMDIAQKGLAKEVHYEPIVADVPQQKGGNDCGVFCLAYASYLTSGKEITTNPNQVCPHNRNAILYLFL